MYLFFGIFFLILLFFFCLNYWRRKKIIKKICCMSTEEKCCLLDELIKPFGFCYIAAQDIFTSHINAMQREFGYCSLYDKTALTFHMVFDYLPVYFNYNGRTWLIEFWKGQYGINTGAEIGIYHADTIIPEADYKKTLFSCAERDEMLDCTFRLCNRENDCVSNAGRHWWLTAFLVGCFSKPANLSMESCIRFPNREMLCAFVEGLKRAGCGQDGISVNGLSVCFCFCECPEHFGPVTRFLRCFSQWKNKLFCKLYLWVTRPFVCTEDRILYLYFYLPVAFRRLLRLRRFKKHGHRPHCKGR